MARRRNARKSRGLHAKGAVPRDRRELEGDAEEYLGAFVPRVTMPPPGTAPGMDAVIGEGPAADAVPVEVTCIDYAPDRAEVELVADIHDFLSRHRPSWSHVRWINVDGVAHPEVIRALAEKYQLHTLAIEDVVRGHQRAKLEEYPGSADQPGRLFLVTRTVEDSSEGWQSDQISFFLGRNTLLTFQHLPGDEFDPVRARIQTAGSRLREHDASFLLYTLVDAIVDHFFPVLESFAERLEDVEERIFHTPERNTLREIHHLKRDLLLIRRTAWPMREVVARLQRDKLECLSATAQTYLRDVYDNCIQVIDLVEVYREITGDLTDTFLSNIANRTNETMKLLTILGTIFIPLTFLAGVYGMNMWIPEAEWRGMYFAFWAGCIVITAGMLTWFRRKGWI